MARMFIPRCILMVVLLFGSSAGAAGEVVLDISTTCTTTETGVRLNVTLANLGSEAAMDLNISTRCEDAAGSLDIPGPLGPGQSGTFQISIDPDLPEPGTYAVITHVKYHDQTGYPFTTMDAASFAYTRPAPSMIFPQMTTMVLKGASVLLVDLSNADAEEHRVLVWLEVPETLKCLDGPRELQLSAQGQGQVSFRVENRFAGLNSTQPLVVRTVYDDKGLKHTAVVKGYVTIGRPEKFFRQYGKFFLAAAGLALAVVLVIQVVRGEHRPGPNGHQP
jgi:hypothetical protein